MLAEFFDSKVKTVESWQFRKYHRIQEFLLGPIEVPILQGSLLLGTLGP